MSIMGKIDTCSRLSSSKGQRGESAHAVGPQRCTNQMCRAYKADFCKAPGVMRNTKNVTDQ